MDLCGPSAVESVGKKKYILVIVDDFSRFTWVLFLRNKSDAAEEIINFIKDMEFNDETDEGIFHGYSSNSKAYRVMNKRTLKIEETFSLKFDD
ncbi:hypothetical protein L2E82_35197 [Cichorium intybus]|uniref:Uncharacterized protein n=1 Tax=Cichorium intybus TaxID=13427 RepID=A0ACB9BNJ5_CICIN|nr:hypothetical protein L2E82_35197 [Cichorium intybus]